MAIWTYYSYAIVMFYIFALKGKLKEIIMGLSPLDTALHGTTGPTRHVTDGTLSGKTIGNI